MAILLLTLTVVVVYPTRSVQAFKPTIGRRASSADETHASLTMEAIVNLLKDPTFISPAPVHSDDPDPVIMKAINNIIAGNASVDTGFSFLSEKNHFDAESFVDGQIRLVGSGEEPGGLLQGILTDLNAKNVLSARNKLGQALHSIQDFYSHSNWVEMLQTSPNQDLGRIGNSHRQNLANMTAGLFDQTCNSCLSICPDCYNNITTQKLTSGYFFAIPPPFNLLRLIKCGHGGLGDTSGTPVGGINKDSSICFDLSQGGFISPHANLHAEAARIARSATEQFIRDLKDQIMQHLQDGPRKLKLLFGIGPTLTFCIDTTGSMGDIINQVKQQAIQIVEDRRNTVEAPSKYVLAPFNDPFTGPVTVTDNPDTFEAAISGLSASGGDDCPEFSMTGMLQGLSASDDGGDLFMFTDADAKDSGLASAVSSLAASKDIKIFPCVFGSCSFASFGQTPPTKPLINESNSLQSADPAYTRIANDSGGQLFALNRNEAGNITGLANLVVRSNAVNLLSIADVLTSVATHVISPKTAKTYNVPIDSTMTGVTFSVSGTTSVVLKRPDGSTVTPTIVLSNGLIYSITSPSAGNWSVIVDGSGPFSLAVFGESSLFPSSFDFVELGGRPAHEGLFPIPGLPLAGQVNTVHAALTHGFNYRSV
jgi:hypothetical protein